MASLMDSLPNEMILEIFSHFDKLDDRALLAQVSRRFNSLSDVRTWRKKIIIEIEDIVKHRLYKFKNNRLLQEAKMSINLESIIITEAFEDYSPMEKEINWKFHKTVPYMFSKIFNTCLKLNEVVCDILNKSGDIVYSIDHIKDRRKLFISHCEMTKYFDKMVNCLPVKFSFLSHFGPQTQLQTCIDRSSEELEYIECGSLTLNTELLSILHKCKKLTNIAVYDSFDVEPGLKLIDLPKLNLQSLVLEPGYDTPNVFHNHPELLDMFIADSLTRILIADSVLAGCETWVLKKCKNLEFIEISTGPQYSLSDEEAINFYKNVLTLFKQSTKLTSMKIILKKENISNIFKEEVLPLVQHYGIEEIVDSCNSLWTTLISKSL